MKIFPVNFVVEGALCVVVGGGEVAARRVAGLLEAGSSVKLICREPRREALDLANGGAIEIVKREFRPGDLEGAKLVFAATDDREANREVAAEARERGIPVNVADDPGECDFFTPAIVRRGEVVVAIGTGGSSPALASRIREIVEATIGEEFGGLTSILGELRARMKSKGINPMDRKADFDALLKTNVLDLLRTGDAAGVKKIISGLFGDVESESGK